MSWSSAVDSVTRPSPARGAGLGPSREPARCPDPRPTPRGGELLTGGEAIFGPTIARRLTEYFTTQEQTPRTTPAQAFPDLTEREHEVLSLMAEGYTNTAIASHLYLSPKTVRNYVSSIFTKLQVTDRPQAIVRAREAGLGHERA